MDVHTHIHITYAKLSPRFPIPQPNFFSIYDLLCSLLQPAVERIIVHKMIRVLIRRTCEYVNFYGRRDFADMIKNF